MLSPILSVIDIDESIEFYKSVLSFTEGFVLKDDDGKTNFAMVKLGGAEILLGTIDFVEEDNINSRGIGIQLYIEVPPNLSIDQIYNQCLSNNANINKEIENRDWGERVFTLYDPDGYNLMLAQRIKES